MLQNIRAAFQALHRHRRTAKLNIFGFAIALSAVILIGLYAWRELTVNLYHQDVERIYKISGWAAPYPLATTIAGGVSEIEAITNIFSTNGICGLESADGKAVNTRFGFAAVDPDFFDVFTFPVVAGDPRNPLPDVRSIALTESAAESLFGDDNPIGQTVITTGLEGRGPYVVTAVLKEVPLNSSIRFSVVFRFNPNMNPGGGIPYGQNWKAWDCEVFAKLVPGAEVETVNRKMQEVVRARGHLRYEVERVVLYPLSDIYFNRPQVWTRFAGGEYSKVMAMIVVGAIILLMAIMNFFNLSTASSLVRSKEIGLRKVNGATRRELIVQFLSESVGVTLIAMVLALIIVNLILPLFGLFVGVPYPPILLTHPWEWLLLVGGSLAVGCIAGSYPAFYLSSIDPIRAIYSERTQTGFGVALFRKVLIVFQLVASIAIMACVFVISGQLNYLRTKDTGFDREQIICIGMDAAISRQKQAFFSEIAALPGVKSMCLTAGILGSGSANGGEKLQGNYRGQEKELWGQYIYTDTAFFKTFGIELIEGRVPRSYEKGSVVVNETAVRALDIEHPLEMTITPKGGVQPGPDGSLPESKIVGVCKDFHYDLLNKSIEPAFMTFGGLQAGVINLRLDIASMDDAVRIVDELKRIYKEFNSQGSLDFVFLNTMLNQMYQSEMKFQLIFSVFTVFSIVIACFGLFGLIIISNVRRKKEIGIRKVQGATIRQVVYLLIRGYLFYVGIAFLIAVPIAYYYMSRWLGNYPYKVGLHAWFFGLAGVIVLLIVVLTVGLQSWKAAKANPVESLKSE